MLRAKTRFNAGIQRARNLHALYIHLTTIQHFPPDTVSDLLRSEIVYVVSSFDKFIHDIVKQGMVDTFVGRRVATNAYKNFNITLEQFEAIKYATLPPPEGVFENTIIENHNNLSFQDPEKVAGALSLIWNEQHKWQSIANCMGKKENDIRIELKNIVIRRNQIVHEGDINLMSGQLQILNEPDVIESINFIEELGNCIYSLI
jgi:hypothetical protein